jgi:hypothetical protein
MVQCLGDPRGKHKRRDSASDNFALDEIAVLVRSFWSDGPIRARGDKRPA